MTIDSFKFLPRLIATYYRMTDCTPDLPIPWTPVHSAVIGSMKTGVWPAMPL